MRKRELFFQKFYYRIIGKGIEKKSGILSDSQN